VRSLIDWLANRGVLDYWRGRGGFLGKAVRESDLRLMKRIERILNSTRASPETLEKLRKAAEE
jgi:hypothetical protein